MKKYWFIAMVFVAMESISQAQNQIPGYVINSSAHVATTVVSSGKVAGYLENGIYTFKGIPYAEAGRFDFLILLICGMVCVLLAIMVLLVLRRFVVDGLMIYLPSIFVGMMDFREKIAFVSISGHKDWMMAKNVP